MKKLLSTMFSAFALMTHNASATTTLPESGNVTFTWTITQQATSYQLVSSNRTATTKGTNITTLYASTITSSSFANADLLKLLANSFHTTFPAGAKLVTDGYYLYVADKTGTNVIVEISGVVSVNFEDYDNSVFKSSDKETQNTTKSSTLYSGTYTSTVTSLVDFNYNDSEMTTTDGTHSAFQFYGLSVTSNDSTYSNTSDSGSQNFTVTGGSGAGQLRGKLTVFGGNISGKVTGSGD